MVVRAPRRCGQGRGSLWAGKGDRGTAEQPIWRGKWRNTPGVIRRSGRISSSSASTSSTWTSKVDRFREELSGRIDALDQNVDRFREEFAGRIGALDGRLSARIDVLDQKFSRWFSRLTGILVTALLAQMGLLGAALFAR